jgi:hypothetical protein
MAETPWRGRSAVSRTAGSAIEGTRPCPRATHGLRASPLSPSPTPGGVRAQYPLRLEV